MKINLFKIFLILGIISFLLVPYIAGKYDAYKSINSFSSSKSWKQLDFNVRLKSNLASSFIYWYFWVIPSIFLGLAWYVNNKKK